ncbi:hypothetical protein N7512_008725 [Penicillium capsulatum]|nr:hypothetical protein N7512_008725 [Penicillium capsulatum]
MSSDSKTKIRPQQSCLKCRERKVKCDRSIPCHACILRGLEAECTYLSSAEDRAQINQAEMIHRLRREVAQLRGQLAQTPGPAPRREYDMKFQAHSSGHHGAASAAAYPIAGAVPGSGTVGAGEADGNWAASPESSSTNMTHSMTVTSPDSTGSERGASVPPVHSYAAGPYGTQIAELDLATTAAGAAVCGNQTPLDEATISTCHSSMVPLAGEVPMMHLPSTLPPDLSGMTPMQTYGRESPGHPLDGGAGAQAYMALAGLNAYKPVYPGNDGQSHVYHSQWNEHAFEHQDAAPPWQDALSYQFINAVHHADPNAASHFPVSHHVSLAPGAVDSLYGYSPPPTHSFSSSWRGQEKQDLLETLLQTIGSCHAGQVAQVVQVVRTSATPEEAVSGICQVLGISAP